MVPVSLVNADPCLLDIATGQTGVTSATAATAAISTTRHIDRVHMMVMRLNNAIDDYIIVISMHSHGTPVQK
ncbi:hypothetical protein HBI42_036980 [Parastagonospora nodorum]|nr:hypothetical protein HBI42_036980 [Parastagonospora nodorum]